MYKLRKTEQKDHLSPKEALRLIDINTYEGQRPLRPKKVQEYKDKILDGTFRRGDFAIARQFFNGQKEILINGQHQAHASVIANKGIRCIIDYYDVFTPEDLSLLYRQFDPPGRSLADILRPEAIALEVNWPSHVISRVVAGAALKAGLMGNCTKEKKVELLKDNLSSGAFVCSIIDNSDAKHLNRRAVVCAMLSTWERSQQDSNKFWVGARDGDNISKTKPPEQAIWKIRNWLMQVTVATGRGTFGLKRAADHEIVSRCITAWNAFRRKENTDIKYYKDKPIPRAI